MFVSVIHVIMYCIFERVNIYTKLTIRIICSGYGVGGELCKRIVKLPTHCAVTLHHSYSKIGFYL